MTLIHQWLGELAYESALALQRDTRAAVLDGADNTLLLLTHPHTITVGRHGNMNNIVARPILEQRGATIHRVDRGGDVTYHGPGQLVGYPIVNLMRLKLGVRAYVCALSDALRSALAGFGITATWDDEAPGLWVGREKICAFGVHVHRNVTTHGFAINVAPDLSFYSLIVPCGLATRGVTSMAAQLGEAPPMSAVRAAVVAAIQRRFDMSHA